jgi:hypothetical protein
MPIPYSVRLAPMRWLMRQYAKLTPWKDDDKLADALDEKIKGLSITGLGCR